ncbi:unnamed protein product [Effrenium voratum]|nr:unnamed protein product [Effrenium voratum]
MAVKDNGHIFVSIASYRDSQCQYTIRDMFEKARFPERIVAGVCHQVAPDDHECFMLDLDHWASQIRTYFLPHTDSKGPCFARAMIQKHLMQDEEFYFQIDSHMRFVLHWDQVLLDQLDACPSPRPVITSLQASYELPRDYQPGEPDRAALSRRHGMTLLCADKFGDQCPGQDDAFLRIGSRLCLGEVSSPPPALFWTARFHFSRSLAARECPYDPYLDYIFFGEEISMAARLFTSGWDCFNPTKVICYHLQSRSHRPFYTEVQRSELAARRHRHAQARLYRLLGVERFAREPAPAPATPYGLGTRRSLAEYESFCGVSFKEHRVMPRARRGGELAVLPCWAEELRQEMLAGRCFTDPEVWAGRGNADALARQFPGKIKNERAELEEQRAELCQQLAVRGSSLEQLLQRSQAAAQLARLQCQLQDFSGATSAAWQSLRFCEEAEVLATEAEARCLVLMARANALAALCRWPEAKRAAGAALSLAQGDELALAAVELLHRLHELTEDRAGLAACCGRLRALLPQASVGKMPMVLSASPPPEMAETCRARLVEAVLLSLLASDTQEGEGLAREVLQSCAGEVAQSTALP